jgi:hypothetical protein
VTAAPAVAHHPSDLRSKTVARPTIEDVATRAGVPESAVSFARNGRPGVAADTRM